MIFDADWTSVEDLTHSDLNTLLHFLQEKRGAAVQQMVDLLTTYVFSLLEQQDSSQSYVFERLEPAQLEKANLDSEELITAFDIQATETAN